MKFVNYGIPTGLGIKEFNANSNKYSNLNGITNKDIKNTLDKIQIGGTNDMSYLPCETVFYIIEHPITLPEVQNVELTDDEELSEEIELSKMDQRKSTNDDKQSKLIGEKDTSSESSIKSTLKNAIEFMVQNHTNNKKNTITSFEELFPHNKNDEVSHNKSHNKSYDTSYDTSHASFKSILRALKNSKNTT